MDNFDTSWNGDSCFRVKVINNNNVKVIKLKYDDDKYVETDVEFDYNVENVYIGYSPVSYTHLTLPTNREV